MSLEDKLSDAIVSKITGKKIETVDIPLEQMVGMVKRVFIDSATSAEELQNIEKAIRMGKKAVIPSKDGRYELRSAIYGFFNKWLNFKKSYIWIQEVETGKIYQYRAFNMSKLIGSCQGMAATARINLNQMG